MTTFVIASTYERFVNWCHENGENPRDRRAVVPMLQVAKQGGVRGRRWQDGIDAVVMVDGAEFFNIDELYEALRQLTIIGCPREKLPL